MRNCITGKDQMTGLDTNIPLPRKFHFTEEQGAHESKLKT
jgi:hypothetical protein